MKPKMLVTHMLLTLVPAVVCSSPVLTVSAQVQTQTNTTTHAATVATKVERGEVVYVNGNELVVKMEDGSLRHFANVPESSRVLVEGKELGIHDLKVGMKLEKTITTTTTPKTITTVQTVKGKVWNISPPNSVTLTLEDGTNQRFKIPKDQKFNVNGQMTDAWGLKKGMNVTATKIVEQPGVQVQQEAKLTGSMPVPPPPPADAPILIAAVGPGAVPETAPQAAAEPPKNTAPQAPAELPKTGSPLSTIGFVGLVSLAAALGLRAVRRFV
jgi:LPXTG-motif cell wall-anchored protein